MWNPVPLYAQLILTTPSAKTQVFPVSHKGVLYVKLKLENC